MVVDASRPPQRGGRISLLVDPEPTTLVAFTDSAAMALFLVATVISFHSNFADQNQMIHFLKNVMMAGGLLQIAAFGGGVLSGAVGEGVRSCPRAGCGRAARPVR